MTYDSREESQYAGEPVECYRFSSGSQIWLVTSADEAVTLPVGIFAKETISRGPIDRSQEVIAGALDVTLARTHEIGELFLSFAPERPLSLILYRAHRGEESDYIVAWTGVVVAASFEGAELKLNCLPDGSAMRRKAPSLAVQRQCPWDLYGVGCGADKPAFTDLAVVTTIVGLDVVTNDFLIHPSGWYDNGWLEKANGDRRMVARHLGNTVTLKARFRTLAAGEAVSAVAGCARTAEACLTKFNNVDVNGRIKFAGFDRMPGRNPYTGRIV